MEMKKFFETVRIGAAEMAKEYLPMCFLIGNCAFSAVVATFVVKAFAASYLGIELGHVATLVHAIPMGAIGGIWLCAFMIRVKSAIAITLETGVNLYSAWKMSASSVCAN